MLLFLLVLGAAVCSSAVVSAQGMGPSCPDPFSARAFSPLLLFANPEDVSQIFAGGLPNALVLVEDGRAEPALTFRDFAVQNIPVFDTVQEIPVIWCIQNTELDALEYSISVVSDNLTVVSNPAISIPQEGIVTTVPYRFRLIFRCQPTSTRKSAGITMSINISNSATGEEYCPIEFYFGKRCSSNSEILSAEELPTGLLSAGITDGFLSNSNLSAKATRAPMIIPPQDSTLSITLKAVLIPLCIIALVALGVVALAWGVWYQRSKSRVVAEFRPEALALAYREVYASVKSRGEHEKEFPLSKVNILRELGEGAFGVVSQAQAYGIVEGEECTDVAIKQLRPGSSDEVEFFREVDFMSGLDHPNIVRLLGVCSLEEPFSMVFEYMDLGDLCSYLREAIGLGKDLAEEDQEDTPLEPLLTHEELLTIVLQVAQGMEYISSKHLVHRDLASRNCLVATGLVVKIADFGMSRDINTTDYYRVHGSALLPVRWMPPESVLYGKFTVESDIWAFGILLWEVFTFGQQPYSGLNNDEVIGRIKDGKYPEPPECPANKLMLQCWNRNPKKRPSFQESKHQIEMLLKQQ